MSEEKVANEEPSAGQETSEDPLEVTPAKRVKQEPEDDSPPTPKFDATTQIGCPTKFDATSQTESTEAENETLKQKLTFIINEYHVLRDTNEKLTKNFNDKTRENEMLKVMNRQLIPIPDTCPNNIRRNLDGTMTITKTYDPLRVMPSIPQVSLQPIQVQTTPQFPILHVSNGLPAVSVAKPNNNLEVIKVENENLKNWKEEMIKFTKSEDQNSQEWKEKMIKYTSAIEEENLSLKMKMKIQQSNGVALPYIIQPQQPVVRVQNPNVVQEHPMTQQIQFVRSPDGKIVVCGLLPGQQVVKLADGGFQIVCRPMTVLNPMNM